MVIPADAMLGAEGEGLRVLFDDELGADTIRALLDDLRHLRRAEVVRRRLEAKSVERVRITFSTMMYLET